MTATAGVEDALCAKLRFYSEEDLAVKISARNQLRGKVTAIKMGSVMAQVTIQVGSNEIVSAITRDSVEQMKIKVGDEVIAVVKSTEVMIALP